jgi:hypothetical protein
VEPNARPPESLRWAAIIVAVAVLVPVVSATLAVATAVWMPLTGALVAIAIALVVRMVRPA